MYFPSDVCTNAAGPRIWPTIVGGRPPAGARTSTAGTAVAAERTRLVASSFQNSFKNIGGSRQDDFFEVRAVRHWRVERRDTLDRRIEIFEEVAGRARRQLRAEAAGQLVFVR